MAFVAQQPEDSLFISSVSFAEVRYGIKRQPDLAHRYELEHWLEQVLRPMFRQRVLPVTEDIMLAWRLILDEGRKRRHTFSQPDLIIAATAQHHGLTLVTRNTADYTLAPVNTHNPWLD